MINGVPEGFSSITKMLPNFADKWIQMEETQLNGVQVSHYQLRVFDVEET